MTEIPREARGNKIPARLAIDFIGAIFSIGPVALAWSSTFLLGVQAHEKSCLIAYLLISPLLAALLLVTFIRLFRVVLPHLEGGVCRVGFNRMTLGWFGHIALNRATKLSGLRPLLFSFFTTRFLLFRALGARISFDVSTSIEVLLVDLPLITIGPGTILGEDVHIICHYFLGDRLFLKPTVIGSDCFLGMRTVVGPGSRLGDKVWVGYGNVISGEKIADGTEIKNVAWAFGSVGKEKPEFYQEFNERLKKLEEK